MPADPMNEPWLYVSELPPEGVVSIAGREAKHAAGARRVEMGDAVTLFNGRGAVARATIAGIDRRARMVEATVRDVEQRVPLRPAVHLACALPKGDRQSVMLNMAAQLGMTSFTPLMCQRSVVKPGRSFADRAQRICLEACKQSRQPHAPTIHPAARLGELFERLNRDSGTCFMLHPVGEPMTAHVPRDADGHDAYTLIIGPEGGFTDSEVALAREQGAGVVSMGSLILRIETAAIAALSWFRIDRV